MSELPAQRGGAKALLLTVFGEFVLPAGGTAWTSTLVAAAEALGLNEKNARQALARLGDQRLIESQRVGRRARWSLTDEGRNLLEAGTRRIYGFGRTEAEWEGEWLVVHSSIAESERSTRSHLRTELAFQGFGQLSAGLAISPHSEREEALRSALASLGLAAEALVLRSRTGSVEEDASIVARAWDLETLGETYRSFIKRHDLPLTNDQRKAFCAQVELVHDWRRFPSIDPELPAQLLPDAWVGAEAVEFFHRRHAQLNGPSQCWWRNLEPAQ